MFKPSLGGECEIFLSENSRHTLLTERTLGDHPLDTRISNAEEADLLRSDLGACGDAPIDCPIKVLYTTSGGATVRRARSVQGRTGFDASARRNGGGLWGAELRQPGCFWHQRSRAMPR
jgi:hypothetical protein